MPKGEALKQYKQEQRAETRQKLEEAIAELKYSKQKVSVANVAQLSGVSRANIYANYHDLFKKNSSTKTSKTDHQHKRKKLDDQEQIIQKLKEENRQLRQANAALIHEVVALKLLLGKQ